MRADISCRSQHHDPQPAPSGRRCTAASLALPGGVVIATSAQKHASCCEFVTLVLAQQGDIDKCFSDAGRWAIVEFG